jgi:hypothetical protein
MENTLSNSIVHPRSRRSRRIHSIGHRMLGVAITAGWVIMPLTPVLALAYTWFNGLS